MVSNSAKLDCRTKQHTQLGVSASNGSRDMPRTKSWQKKRRKKNNKANWMVSNSAQLDRRTKQHTQFGVSASNGSRDIAWTKSWRKKRNKKKNNKANWMVSNSAQLHRRTKQHTQFGVSVSNGSRYMGRTKSWRKKKKKKNEKNEHRQSHKASPTGIANETGSRLPCMRPRSDPTKMKNSTQTTLPHFNFSVTAELNDATSVLIIFNID